MVRWMTRRDKVAFDRRQRGIFVENNNKKIPVPETGTGDGADGLADFVVHTGTPQRLTILIHAYSAIVPPGAARIAAQKQEKSPLRRPERGVLGLAISRTYNLRRLRKSSRG